MPEMLVVMIDDVAHAFGNRLILHMDTVDAGEAAGALYFAIDPVVVGLVLGQPPSPIPVGGVGTKFHSHRESGRDFAIAQLARPRGVALPRQMNEHRMRIVYRHPRAHNQM